MKRPLLIFLVLVAAAVAVWWFGFRRPAPIVLTGIVTTDDVIVSSEIQGRLDKLLVNQGDVVKKGDLLALIQPEEWKADMSFYSSSEQQSQSQVTQAEANLASAVSQVKMAQADLENAGLTFQREESLYQQGAEPKQAYDQARTAYDAAQAHVDSLQKQMQAAQATLEAITHQLAAAGAQKQKAQVQLDYTEIRAPIDGVVDVRAALQGEVVNPGQGIVTLVDPDDLWVRADVEETYIDSIRLGQKMTVRLPSGAEREGTVFFRGIDADFATQRDVSRTKRDIKTFEVRLRCDNRDRSLALSMTAYVLLPVPHH